MYAVLKYRAALKSLPAPGGNGCHAALMRPANAAARAGVPEAQAITEIHAAIPEGGRHVPESEVAAAVRRAYADKGQFTPPPQRAAPAVDWVAYRARLLDRHGAVDEADLWTASPIFIDWEPGPRDALEVLRALYGDRERLFIGGRLDKVVKPVSYWRADIARKGSVPEHVAPNPLTGMNAPTKAGGTSPRCDMAVAAFSFVVAEMDTLPRPEQLRLWFSIVKGGLLPVALLVDSGGKSIHGWLRVNCPDVAAWNEVVRGGLYAPGGPLSGLGFDRACANPSRLSRMPGAWRADKGAWQRLLYLNPEAGKHP